MAEDFKCVFQGSHFSWMIVFRAYKCLLNLVCWYKYLLNCYVDVIGSTLTQRDLQHGLFPGGHLSNSKQTFVKLVNIERRIIISEASKHDITYIITVLGDNYYNRRLIFLPNGIFCFPFLALSHYWPTQRLLAAGFIFRNVNYKVE